MEWLLLLTSVVGGYAASQQLYVKINHSVVGTKLTKKTISLAHCALTCHRDDDCFIFNWYKSTSSCEFVKEITDYWIDLEDGQDTYISTIDYDKRILYNPYLKTKNENDDYCASMGASVAKYPATHKEKEWMNCFGFYFLGFIYTDEGYIAESDGQVFDPTGLWTSGQPSGVGVENCLILQDTGVNDVECDQARPGLVPKTAAICVVNV